VSASAGWAVGALHDGGTRPLALGVASSAALCALAAWALLRRDASAPGQAGTAREAA